MVLQVWQPIGLLLFCTLVHAIKGDVSDKKKKGGRRERRREKDEGMSMEARQRGGKRENVRERQKWIKRIGTKIEEEDSQCAGVS